TFYYSPVWSPDSKKIVYSDKRLNLWYVNVDGGTPVLIDTNTYDADPGSGFNPVWSPDSRWVAYTRQLNSGMRAAFIYGLEDKTPHQVTDGMSDAAFVAFDRNGMYLYFMASTDDGPANASSMGAFKVPVTAAGYVIVLRKDLKSPLAPQSDEEKVAVPAASSGKTDAANKEKPIADLDDCKPEGESGAAGQSKETAGKESDKDKDKDKDAKAKKDEDKSKETPAVKIDFDNIDQRILSLPFPVRNYGRMVAGKTH